MRSTVDLSVVLRSLWCFVTLPWSLVISCCSELSVVFRQCSDGGHVGECG